MLDALRKGAGTWLAQLFIALLVVSFAVWGVSDIFRGFRSDTVATVGNTDITTQTFLRQYEIATRALGQQLGQPVSAEQAQLFGLPGQVLGRLVADATLNDEAATLNLGVSGDTLAQQIAESPDFRGGSGAFDRNRFQQLIQANGLTEDQYVEQLRENFVRQQIADALVGGTKAPEAYMKAVHEYRAEERKISYVLLAPALVGTIPDPSDTELQTWFDANKADWKAPEMRAIRVMAMRAEDLADTGAISDDAAKQLYDAQVAARFTTPERRKVEQIIFKDKAEADAAAAALASGKTFDQLIADRQLKPADVDLGLVTKDKLLDPAVADAAFALAANSVSGVIDGRFGPVIVRVTTVEPQVIKTFDEVKADIVKELATEKARAELADQHDVIEDARAGGETLEEIAKKYDLTLLTLPAVDKAGRDADGKDIADLPGGSELVAAVFNSDVGLENAPLTLSPLGYVWYEVTGVTPERDRQLTEVKDKVAEAWKKDQLASKLAAMAKDVNDRLAAGEDIAKVATEKGLAVKTAEKLSRSTQANGDLSNPAILAAFSGPKGHAATAPAPEDSLLVLVVTDVTTPPYFAGTPDLTQADAQLSGQMATDFLQQYVVQLQSDLGLAINQTVLQQAIGGPTGGG